ncbi:hypothetical protein [Heyndrickxia coagulans]|nr:hypothetical protein [Heyndrickxia coagulans]WNE62998.1 hypothetical protein KIY57_07970 [Heyndrickxia coagulans]
MATAAVVSADGNNHIAPSSRACNSQKAPNFMKNFKIILLNDIHVAYNNKNDTNVI